MVMLRRPEDPNKRRPQITPMQSPRGVAPTNEPSALQRASSLALDSAMPTVMEKGGEMFTKYVTPMFTPKVVPTAEAAIAADPTLLAGGIPAELTTGIMTGGAKAATGTGLMSSLGSAGTAAMASPLAPIIGGLALAKMFGFFSDGGHVGPLYAADGNLKNVNKAVQKNIDRLKFQGLSNALNKKSNSYVRGNQEKEGYSESDFKYSQNDRRKMGKMINELDLYGGGMAGPLSKVEYKSAGGDVYKLSYGSGPLTKGE